MNDSFGQERSRQFTFDYSYWSADPSHPQNCTQQQVIQSITIMCFVLVVPAAAAAACSCLHIGAEC